MLKVKKSNGNYVHEAVDVAKGMGVHPNAVYNSRNRNDESTYKLDKAYDYKVMEDNCSVFKGDAKAIASMAGKVLEDGKIYEIAVMEVQS